MSQIATSTHFLNTSRDGDSTAALGSLFQCLTTLSVQRFFLISNLNLPIAAADLSPRRGGDSKHTHSRAGHVPHPILLQGCVRRPAAKLVWEQRSSCLLEGKGRYCVWVNKLKPRCSSPSPVTPLRYDARMPHRASFVLCFPQPAAHNAVQSLPSRRSRARPWQLRRRIASPGASGLALSRHVHSSTPGAVSLTTTKKAVCERNPWKGNISRLICNTVKGLLCFGIYRSQALFELCMVLGDHSTPEMWWFPASHSCGMPHFHPSSSRDEGVTSESGDWDARAQMQQLTQTRGSNQKHLSFLVQCMPANSWPEEWFSRRAWQKVILWEDLTKPAHIFHGPESCSSC